MGDYKYSTYTTPATLPFRYEIGGKKCGWSMGQHGQDECGKCEAKDWSNGNRRLDCKREATRTRWMDCLVVLGAHLE